MVILVMAPVLFLVGLAPGVSLANLVMDDQISVGQNPESVFSAIAEAWENSDESTLSDLVHPDGLRVTQGDYDRFTNYSPSQAFYYFKNQFQQRPTVAFQLQRLPETQERNDRVHAMVTWKFRRSGAAAVQELKLVLVLIRQDDQWRLSEINRITKR